MYCVYLGFVHRTDVVFVFMYVVLVTYVLVYNMLLLNDMMYAR